MIVPMQFPIKKNFHPGLINIFNIYTKISEIIEKIKQDLLKGSPLPIKNGNSEIMVWWKHASYQEI